MSRFFGYGSLVHRGTHSYGAPRPAMVSGLRRVWVGTSLREIAFLSVHDAEGDLWGLTAEVPGGDWTALDAREAAYGREHREGLQLYRVAPALRSPTPEQQPLLLSYLDTVAAGYLAEYGPEGVAHFFATTDGWDRPALDDRATPIYPRAMAVPEGLRRAVDAALAALGTPITAPG